MNQEYLVGYGLLGDFGRFRTARSVDCCRGATVVVRSHRGIELGQVLCPALPRHALFLPNTSVGVLLRPATNEDERTARSLHARGQSIFAEARRRAEEQALPLEVLDVEMLLDNDHAVLHLLRWDECDLRDLVSGLSREFSLHILLQDLTRSAAPATEHEDHGCGNCESGSCGSGGCGSGGCGSCATTREDAPNHFAELREQMISSHRTPLL